jgi:hypothetical protein
MGKQEHRIGIGFVAKASDQLVSEAAHILCSSSAESPGEVRLIGVK